MPALAGRRRPPWARRSRSLPPRVRSLRLPGRPSASERRQTERRRASTARSRSVARVDGGSGVGASTEHLRRQRGGDRIGIAVGDLRDRRRGGGRVVLRRHPTAPRIASGGDHQQRNDQHRGQPFHPAFGSRCGTIPLLHGERSFSVRWAIPPHAIRSMAAKPSPEHRTDWDPPGRCEWLRRSPARRMPFAATAGLAGAGGLNSPNGQVTRPVYRKYWLGSSAKIPR